MTTKIWKVQFKENMTRFDVVAKNAGQAVREALRLFKLDVEEMIRDTRKEKLSENRASPWSWYVRHGYNTPEHIELIAESDN